MPCGFSRKAQLVEGRQAVTVRRADEIEQLSVEDGRRLVSGIPGLGDHDELDGDQPQPAALLGLVYQELGLRRVQYPVGHECPVREMQPHGAFLRRAHTTEYRFIARIPGGGGSLVAARRVAHGGDQADGAVLRRRFRRAREKDGQRNGKEQGTGIDFHGATPQGGN
jgi:hypothetical protein